jgi:hypothetical protein
LLESKLLLLDAALQMRGKDLVLWEVPFILPLLPCRNSVGTASGAVVIGEWWMERSGFLRFAAHDETVSSFGRNDNFFQCPVSEIAA